MEARDQDVSRSDGNQQHRDQDGAFRDARTENAANQPQRAGVGQNARESEPEMEWQMRVVRNPEQEAQDVKHGGRMIEIGRDLIEVGAEITGPEGESFVSVDVVGAVSFEGKQQFCPESDGRYQDNGCAWLTIPQFSV